MTHLRVLDDTSEGGLDDTSEGGLVESVEQVEQSLSRGLAGSASGMCMGRRGGRLARGTGDIEALAESGTGLGGAEKPWDPVKGCLELCPWNNYDFLLI
jgi:hypothetical protein